MTISVVLADANILFSRTLRDYFLYVADAGAIEIHWSLLGAEANRRNADKALRQRSTGSSTPVAPLMPCHRQ